MNDKIVYFSLPLKDNFILKSDNINIPKKEKTIYDCLGYFEDHIFKKNNFKIKKEKISNDYKISNIINLHDIEGLKLNKIIKMKENTLDNKHILTNLGIPNIKIISINNNEKLIFDGHHTLLSYMLSGKKYLSQVPHLYFEKKNNFNEKDIKLFFCHHKNKINDKNWKNFSINWNEKKENQISIKKSTNMGQLYKKVKKEIY